MSAPILAHLVRYFDERGWPYSLDEEARVLSCPVTGQQGNWVAYLRAREAQGQVLLHSLLPGNVPEEHALMMTIFVTRANFGMVMGNFEFDLDSGELRFKTSIDLGGAPLTDALIDPLIQSNLAMVERYWAGIQAVSAGADPNESVREIEAS